MEVQFFPLVPDAVLPLTSPATTRPRVPPGYGVQEHCVPFTAATALGLLVRSPVTFGLCAPPDVPSGAHAFTSPIPAAPDNPTLDRRVFYVVDDPVCRFERNAFTFAAIATRIAGAGPSIGPGISFFDREDQQDLFKLHLPYICRTGEGVDTLFLAPINRVPAFEVLSGLVETDWYADAVNLILRKPRGGEAVHVMKGDPVGQMIFIDRSHRRPDARVVPDHARATRDAHMTMREWQARHAEDRSAYKKLARSRHGQADIRTRDPLDRHS